MRGVQRWAGRHRPVRDGTYGHVNSVTGGRQSLQRESRNPLQFRHASAWITIQAEHHGGHSGLRDAVRLLHQSIERVLHHYRRFCHYERL
jgi:hypothetical protein